MEIWKDIKGYEGVYQVSNQGRVKSLDHTIRQKHSYKKGGRVLKSWLYSGYSYVQLCVNGKDKKLKVHRIVAEAFIDNPENKKEVNHINGIRSDNRVENLEWCSHRENILHANKTGLRKTGVNATNAKFSFEDIEFILKNTKVNSHKYGARAMGRKFNVCHETILQILHGITYKQEAEQLGIPTLTPNEIARLKP